jgi:RimJ/RimL family protein N-acetyltransferase
MARGWSGEMTQLVPLDRDKHLDNAVVWLNDPEITEWLLVGDFPLCRLAEEAWFDDVMKRNPLTPVPTHATFAIETLGGDHIGFSGLDGIEWRHRAACSGTVIGRREYWGQGYGSDSVRVRTRYAFEVLGLNVLTSEIFVGNERSKKALEKAGYREVGCVPCRRWKRGEFRDMYIMALTREWWLEMTHETPAAKDAQTTE